MTEQELYEQYLYEKYLQEKADRDPDLPSEDDLVGTPLKQPEGRERRAFSPQESFAGALETVGTLLTSPLAVPGTMYGAVDGAVGSYLQGYEWGSPEFNDNMRARQDEVLSSVMYQPQTEAGQEYLSTVGETLAPLEAIEPLMPAMANMIPSASTMARADAYNSRVRNIDETPVEADMQKRAEAARTAGQSLPSGERLSPSVGAAAAPEIVPDGPAIQANRFVDPETVEMYRDASPETRAVMSETMRRASNGKPAARPEDLPRGAVGNVVAERATALANVRQRYGQRIQQAVQDMTGQLVNTTQLGSDFAEILKRYNITRNEDGSFNLDGSRIADKAANDTLKTIFRRMENKIASGEAEFSQLHTDKQWLQDMADYDAPGQGGSGQLNQAIKDMAASVNRLLRTDAEGNPTAYGLANDAYSATVEPFVELAKISGDKFGNFDDPKTSMRIANKARGLTNNTQQGINIAGAMDQVEALLARAVKDGVMTPEEIADLGFDPRTGKFKGDIHEMAHFLSTVERLHPQQRPGSLASIMDDNAQATGDAVADMALGAATGGKFQLIRGLKDAVDDMRGKPDARSERMRLERDAREEMTNNLLDIVER